MFPPGKATKAFRFDLTTKSIVEDEITLTFQQDYLSGTLESYLTNKHGCLVHAKYVDVNRKALVDRVFKDLMTQHLKWVGDLSAFCKQEGICQT